jgi:hypothetical protein
MGVRVWGRCVRGGRAEPVRCATRLGGGATSASAGSLLMRRGPAHGGGRGGALLRTIGHCHTPRPDRRSRPRAAKLRAAYGARRPPARRSPCSPSEVEAVGILFELVGRLGLGFGQPGRARGRRRGRASAAGAKMRRAPARALARAPPRLRVRREHAQDGPSWRCGPAGSCRCI